MRTKRTASPNPEARYWDHMMVLTGSDMGRNGCFETCFCVGNLQRMLQDLERPGFAEKDVGNGSAGHLTQEPLGASGNFS